MGDCTDPMMDYADPMTDNAEGANFNDNQRNYTRCDHSRTWQPFTSEEVIKETVVVCNATKARCIVQHLLDEHKTIAVDLRGRDFDCDPPRGKICLIAIATCNGKCVIFDIHLCPQILIVGRLKKLLECYTITKVMHNCKSLRAYLVSSLGVELHTVFDTHWAHALLEHHRNGTDWNCVQIESVSFISIVYGRCLQNPAKHAMQRLCDNDSNFWETRPISVKLREYVARDVLCLVPEAYDKLRREIPDYLKQTFEDLCDNNTIDMVDDNTYGKGECQKKIRAYKKKICKLKERMKCTNDVDDGSTDQDDSSSMSSDHYRNNARNRDTKTKSASDNKVRRCGKSTQGRTSKNNGADQSKNAKISVKRCASASREYNQQKPSPARIRVKPCVLSSLRRPPTPPINRKRKLASPCCKKSPPKKVSSKECTAKRLSQKECVEKKTNSRDCFGKKVPQNASGKKCPKNAVAKKVSCKKTQKNYVKSCSCTDSDSTGKRKSSCKKIPPESLVRAGKQEVGDSTSDFDDDDDDDDLGVSMGDDCNSDNEVGSEEVEDDVKTSDRDDDRRGDNDSDVESDKNDSESSCENEPKYSNAKRRKRA